MLKFSEPPYLSLENKKPHRDIIRIESIIYVKTLCELTLKHNTILQQDCDSSVWY